MTAEWKPRRSAEPAFHPTAHFTNMQDVIVIGSGLSALTAARVLKAHKPLLLEARNRVGGRANTYKQCAQPVDLGCSMVHGVAEGNPITQTLKEYGLPVSLQPRLFCLRPR